MNLPQNRIIHVAIALACFLLVAMAIYIEPFASMNPCPMCMMQRFAFAAVGLVAVVAALHNPLNGLSKVYGALLVVFSAIGASIAARQVWLQGLPEDQVPACGPGLDYMLEVFPLLEVIEMAIRGTGDCAEVQWTFIGLSIPGWSFIAFCGMAIAGLYMVIRKPDRSL